MKTATLKIYGDIADTVPDIFIMEGVESISAKKVSDFLDDHKDADLITVRINSRGGDVQEGWAIHDLLVNSGKKIKTIGEGKVYSIATIVFLAGTEREMMKNADGLIHNPFIPPYTLADQYESEDLIKIADSLKQEEAKILDYYATRTGTPKEKLAEYMKDETKLSAEDMLSLGFATKVLEPIVAYAFIGNVKNKSFKMDEKAFFEKLGSTLDSAITKLKNFSRLDPKALVLTDADGNQLTLEKESGDPAVGDVASPDGTFTMEDGTVIVVEDGVVTSITPPAEPEMSLDEAKQKIAALELKISEMENKTEEMTNMEAAAKQREAAASEIINELTALKNSWKPEGRTKKSTLENKGEKTAAVNLERVREIRAKLNPKTE